MTCGSSRTSFLRPGSDAVNVARASRPLWRERPAPAKDNSVGQRVAQTPPLRLRLVFGRTANAKAASAAQEPPFEEVALA